MLRPEDSTLIIIDIQDKLVKACAHSETIGGKAVILGEAAKILSIPIVVTEQYPRGLGDTIPLLKDVLADDTSVVEKTNFSALREDGFKELVAKYGRKQIVLCGIETHICVYQTCAELLEVGYEVFVAKDCVSSRKEFEHITGLRLMEADGAKLSCVEAILFEWLGSSKHPKFKEVQNLIK